MVMKIRCPLGQLACDGSFVDKLQRSITNEAPAEWRDGVNKPEPFDYFRQLYARIGRANEVAAPDLFAFEQPHIAREKYAVFNPRNCRKLFVR
jgi:hypothetical protein